MNTNEHIALLLQWTARITGLVSISFLLFMIGGHLFGPEPSAAPTHGEMVTLFFFPASVVAGLIIALKWEGLGGFITVVGIAGFHISTYVQHGSADFVFLIDVLALPGVLFILYWILNRRANT